MLQDPQTGLETTIGEYASAIYEAALNEFNDERVARQIAHQLLTDALARRR